MLKLKIVELEDSAKLATLKARYNKMVTSMNRMARLEPQKDQKKLYEELKV
jgi:hypothetical protein